MSVWYSPERDELFLANAFGRMIIMPEVKSVVVAHDGTAKWIYPIKNYIYYYIGEL